MRVEGRAVTVYPGQNEWPSGGFGPGGVVVPRTITVAAERESWRGGGEKRKRNQNENNKPRASTYLMGDGHVNGIRVRNAREAEGPLGVRFGKIRVR